MVLKIADFGQKYGKDFVKRAAKPPPAIILGVTPLPSVFECRLIQKED